MAEFERAAATRPLDRLHCPLCGLPNECGPAQSGTFDTPCWCTAVEFNAEALAALPAEERGRACICFRCATGAASDPK